MWKIKNPNAARTAIHAFVGAIFVSAISGAAMAQDQQAGVSAAVRGDVQLARSGAVGRQIASAEPIFLQDGITSGSRSGMQIILMDESVFTIGPNSELEIDEFVYDPGQGTGNLAASMTKGVMRFVTGKIAAGKPENMKIKLPVGTIGIRGTVGLIEVLSPEEAQAKYPGQAGQLFGGGGGQAGAPVVFAALVGPGANNNTGANVGSFNLATPDGTVDLNRPGAAVLATPGAPPVFFIAPPGAIQNASAGLDGNGDDEGDEGDGEEGDGGQAGNEEGGQQAQGEGQQASSDDGGNGGGFNAAANESGQGVGKSLTGAVAIGGVLGQTSENAGTVNDLASAGSVSDFTFADALEAAGGGTSSADGSVAGSITGSFTTLVDFSNRTFDIQFSGLSGTGIAAGRDQFRILGGNVGFALTDPAAVFVSNLSDADGFVNAGAKTETGDCLTCEARVIYTGGSTASVEITTTAGGQGTGTANYN